MNSKNKDKEKIAALKMCVSGAFLSGFSTDKVLEDALLILKDAQNEPSLHESSIETGKNLILACLELGFSYMEHMELFDFFMEKAGYTPSMLDTLHRKNKPIHLTYSGIRSVIDSWTASSYNSHTIKEAVNEIIANVSKRKTGTYEYYTAVKDGTVKSLYRLVVYDSGPAVLQNVFANKFYNL